MFENELEDNSEFKCLSEYRNVQLYSKEQKKEIANLKFKISCKVIEKEHFYFENHGK